VTLEIGIVLGVLASALVLFVSERLRPDLVALLVLLALTLSGVLTPDEAFAGFASPVVVTVWAVFILSGALYRSGIATLVANRLVPLASGSSGRLTASLMLASAVLSAFMNNVAVVALLLPAVMDMARRARRPASLLLLPLAYAALLGGMMTLIGTPPNIIVSNAVRAQGLPAFGFFDFALVGGPVMLAGVLYMAVVGRRLLPVRDTSGALGAGTDLSALYTGGVSHFVLRVPADGALDGKTLAESRLGSAVGLNVLALIRGDRRHLAPSPDERLQGGDRLVVEGQVQRLELLRGLRPLRLERARLGPERLAEAGLELVEAEVAPRSRLEGRTLKEAGVRERLHAVVLAVRRAGRVLEDDLAEVVLAAGDVLLLAVRSQSAARVDAGEDLAWVRRTPSDELSARYGLAERLLLLRVPSGSALAGRSLQDSRLGDAFGVAVLAVVRRGETMALPAAGDEVLEGDRLMVASRLAVLQALRALRGLEVVRELPADLEALESARVGLASVVLSPYTRLAGRSLRDLHFREKYGLNVVAIWRSGTAHTEDLRDMALRFGDALLLHGPRQRLAMLGTEPDFLVLTQAAQAPPRLEKAPLAVGVMAAAFVLPLALGWLTAPVAAVLAASLVVLAGCLTMDEAFRFIEWKAVFLIAGMLPLGAALEKTGAAAMIASGVVELAGPLGLHALLAAVFVLTAAASQIMPSAASAVLVTPIAIRAAEGQGMSPLAMAMAVAVAASSSFLSPVGHPANVLVMGPGGYRFRDYLRVGLPLTLVVLLVTMVVLPFFWPLAPAPAP